MKTNLLTKISGIFFCLLIINASATAQVTRTWVYDYNPPNNLNAKGSCLIHLQSGVTITGGDYTNSNSSSRYNILVIANDSGNLISVDTSTLGFGYSKIISDGNSACYALAALQNDSSSARNILVAKIDSATYNIRFFVPDSSSSIYYDQSDMILLSNGKLLVGSRMENFPLIRLALTCLDTTGNIVWQVVDSTFEIKYDLKLLADASGGFFAAGSGRDTSTSEDFIFISHFNASGSRDWFVRQNSPALFFADFLDLIKDNDDFLWLSGIVMDSAGQVGVLMKLDTIGNILWNHTVSPMPYLNLLCDQNNNIYGTTVPANGIDVFTIDKLNTLGYPINTNAFQLPGYFTSILSDIKIIPGGLIAATGELFVWAFPKSDLYLAVFDTMLSLVGYDIYDSLNLFGESGRAISIGTNDQLYVCGRINYENQLETSNLGVIKYQLNLINTIQEKAYSPYIEIAPNPSSGNFNIHWKNLPEGKTTFCIFNSIGELLFEDNLHLQEGWKNYSQKLPDGVLFIRIESKSLLLNKKILVINSY